MTEELNKSTNFSGLRIALLSLSILIILYLSSCGYIAHSKNKSFDLIKMGDSEQDVILEMGNPTVREKGDVLFSRYASKKCQGTCSERFWYENRLSFDTQAWSIDLNKENRVINKSRWISP
jgi:hypothetical protein